MKIDMFFETFGSLFAMPIVVILLSIVYRIVKTVMQEAYLGDLNEEIKKREEELIKEEEPQKINIDKDLQKYFNYKE